MNKETKKKKTTAEMVVMEAPVILEVVVTVVEVKTTAMLEVAEVLATAEVFGGKEPQVQADQLPYWLRLAVVYDLFAIPVV